MRLQPIIYTKDTARAVAWYGTVLEAEPSYESDVWSTFDVGDATLAIHRSDDEVPERSRVELSLVARRPLTDLLERWTATPDVKIARGLQDETFGRSVVLEDPDGTMIQINEHLPVT